MACLFCLGRLRLRITAYKGCYLSVWRSEHLGQQGNKTQSRFYCISSQSATQPLPGKIAQSDSELKLRNSYASPVVGEEYFTMKRKMGTALYPSKESPHSDSIESGNKKAKADQATGCTAAANGDHDNVEHSQDKKIVTEDEDLKITVSKTEHTSAMMAKPLLTARAGMTCQKHQDSLCQQLHQIWQYFPHKSTASLTKARKVNTQLALPKFKPNSASLPVPTTSCSVTSKMGLQHFSSKLPQNGSQATDRLGILFQGSNTSLVMPSFTSVPSRPYHSSSINSTTLPSSKKSKLSPEENDAKNCKENKDKTVKECESSLKEDGGENLKESLGNNQASASVQKKTSSAGKSAVLSRGHGGVQASRRGRRRSGARAKAVEEDVNPSKQCAQGSDAYADAAFEEDYDVDLYRHKLRHLPRQWELTRYGQIREEQLERGSHSRRGHMEFSVMSYNILAQNLLEDHTYLYTGCSTSSLEWEQRRLLLMEEIAHHSPDIINLQEVNTDHFFGYLQPRLERLGYKSCYQKRTGDKSDGCATLWKKDRFELLRSTPVSYCRGGLLDRDNIAIVVELRPLRSGGQNYSGGGDPDKVRDKVVVANTHLLFNPRRGDIKLAQLMILLAEIDKHAYLGPATPNPAAAAAAASKPSTPTPGQYCPIILTGDFNLEPQSALYKFLISGQMNYEGLLLRNMSGQEEGRSGRNSLLERNFFSPMYGVTECCQYHTAVADRHVESFGESVPVSSRQSKRGQRGGRMKAGAVRRACLAAGRLWHHLNLVLAYRHRIERLGSKAWEVTTHHNNGRCSVDYVFYSVDSKDVHFQRSEVRLSSVRDGKLRLLARYGLMSDYELSALGGIPNDLLPSDHLCLITRFLLM